MKIDLKTWRIGREEKKLGVDSKTCQSCHWLKYNRGSEIFLIAPLLLIASTIIYTYIYALTLDVYVETLETLRWKAENQCDSTNEKKIARKRIHEFAFNLLFKKGIQLFQSTIILFPTLSQFIERRRIEIEHEDRINSHSLIILKTLHCSKILYITSHYPTKNFSPYIHT